MVKEKCFDSKINNADFLPIITNPSFVGGENDMNLYLMNNVHYPRQAVDNGIEGRVVLKLWVEKTGYIDSIEVLSKSQPLLDNVLIQSVKNMPLWIPGKADCETQKAHFTLPFVFKIDY